VRPLRKAMHDESSTKQGKAIAMPHEADLSARLKQYLTWAGVKRTELFVDDETRCAISFKDLRATYATWRAIRGDDPLKIQRAAGHKSLNTTQIYIRAAEDLGVDRGIPFPPLPTRLLGDAVNVKAASRSEASEAARHKSPKCPMAASMAGPTLAPDLHPRRRGCR